MWWVFQLCPRNAGVQTSKDNRNSAIQPAGDEEQKFNSISYRFELPIWSVVEWLQTAQLPALMFRSTFWLSCEIRSVDAGNQWSGSLNSVLKRFHWFAPLVSCGNWSDLTTGSGSGWGPLNTSLTWWQSHNKYRFASLVVVFIWLAIVQLSLP